MLKAQKRNLNMLVSLLPFMPFLILFYSVSDCDSYYILFRALNGSIVFEAPAKFLIYRQRDLRLWLAEFCALALLYHFYRWTISGLKYSDRVLVYSF